MGPLLGLVAICLLAIQAGRAQSPFRCNGLADGYQIQYLDQGFKPTVEQQRAVYRRYAYCDKGAFTFPVMFPTRTSLMIVLSDSIVPDEQNAPILLHDTVFFRRKNGKTRAIEVYANGYPISTTDYRANGTLHVHLDYSNHCPGHPESYHFDLFDQRGSRYLTGFFRKNHKGRFDYFSGCE